MTTTFDRARRWASVFALASSLLGVFSGTAQAAPLYGQAFEGASTFQSTSSAQNADSFQFGYAISLTSISFFGTDIDPGNLTVRLFTGDAASLADSFTTLTGTVTRSSTTLKTNIDGFLFDVFEYTLTLGSAYTTAANQMYFVSAFSTDAANWGWSSSAEGDGKSAFRDGDGSTWKSGEPDLAFAVNGERLAAGELPEPVSLALVAVAGVGAVVARRRRLP